MSLFSFAFIFVGSICFSLGFLHLLIYSRRINLKVDLAFSCMAFAIAFSSFFEIWAFKTSSLPEYTLLLKGTLTVQCFLWICFAWFVHYFTRSEKRWPPVLITILYGLVQAINIFSPGSILFREIVELDSFSMRMGEILFFANGPANSFRIIGDAAWIILLIYTATAFIRFGKRENPRKALIFGITIFLCLGLGYLHGTLIDLGIADPPYLGSFLFLPLSLVMSYSLAGDIVKASHLAEEIKVAESRWRNLLENVNLVVLGVDHDKNIFFVNPYFLQTTGYEKNEVMGLPFIEIVPEKDRDAIADRLRTVFTGNAPVLPERHLPIVTKSGEQREIVWSNVLLTNTGSSAAGILGIGRDITDQKKAEIGRDKAIRELESLKTKLEEENISLKEILQTDHGFKEIIGKSDGLLYVLSKIQQVSITDSTVLILGETGTGKELVARAIHQESGRVDKPFIRVNCAAIPADLVESELFGHEQGAFTNAINRRRGKFELAHGGTIFLDEISEMPLEAQAKLLNVIQERELERVGGSSTISVNVRVISATNRDLETEISAGRFRADLFYRLNVYPISIPPLRSRKEDIPLLVKHFVAVFNKKFGKNIEDIPHLVMDILKNYDWPGNIRELQNILERAVITCSMPSLQLPDDLRPLQEIGKTNPAPETEILSLAEVERQHIQRTLQKTDWQISGAKGAASILQMNPSTLRSRVKKLGLKKT
ncbi:MAG: sigma 54-interacting transcriptional regulator [Desulfobulbaceae bacterium]|nr:sigma 54-interacting transcriptional regulator [Desulfobulbaceae bacterium]